jgi:ribosomal protein L11 methyltransferase
MNLQALEAETVEEIFHDHGVLAVTYSDAADDPVLEPLPGETPLWRDTCVTGLFDADADLDALKADLRQRCSVPELPPTRIEALADRAWEREWLRDFQPMRFGTRLWVCPVDSPAPVADATVIRLDPGLAFGTGTHATTALCLERIEALDVAGTRFLDYGCGSGILAIGALLLGAREATAYDIDPQAITATRSNAAQNSVAERLTATTAKDEVGNDYDIVAANILARPLMDLADELALRMRPGGRLILSGILETQSGTLIEAYRRQVRFDEPLLRDGWVCLSGTRL